MNFFASIRNGVQKIRDTWAYRKAMREYAKTVRHCEDCGAPKMLGRIRLEVHHRVPVHVAPERAADKANFICLCASCHFEDGHLGNYRAWNSNLDETIREKRRAWVAYQRRELS